MYQCRILLESIRTIQRHDVRDRGETREAHCPATSGEPAAPTIAGHAPKPPTATSTATASRTKLSDGSDHPLLAAALLTARESLQRPIPAASKAQPTKPTPLGAGAPVSRVRSKPARKPSSSSKPSAHADSASRAQPASGRSSPYIVDPVRALPVPPRRAFSTRSTLSGVEIDPLRVQSALGESFLARVGAFHSLRSERTQWAAAIGTRPDGWMDTDVLAAPLRNALSAATQSEPSASSQSAFAARLAAMFAEVERECAAAAETLRAVEAREVPVDAMSAAIEVRFPTITFMKRAQTWWSRDASLHNQSPPQTAPPAPPAPARRVDGPVRPVGLRPPLGLRRRPPRGDNAEPECDPVAEPRAPLPA